MWGARKKSRDFQELEARLRSAQPEPRDDFVRAVSTRLPPRRQPLVWSRVAFAAAFTTLLLGTFASVGGIGYTVSGASHAYQTVKKLTAAEDVTVDRSAAADQYAPPPQPLGAGPAQVTEAAAAEAVVQAETLPFTGISLLATVLSGIALLAIGLALRRRERRES